MHSDTNTTLERSTNVVTVPGNTHRHQRIDTRGSEEGSGILDAGLTGAGEQNEAEDSGKLEDKHENSTLLHLVGCVSGADGEETGYCVRRNGHELRVFVGVTHVLDDTKKCISFNSMLTSGERSSYVGRNKDIEYNGV
jgi:hypothetical protein